METRLRFGFAVKLESTLKRFRCGFRAAQPKRRRVGKDQVVPPQSKFQIILFFPWLAVSTSDTFSAVKVAPRKATNGHQAVIERLNE